MKSHKYKAAILPPAPQTVLDRGIFVWYTGTNRNLYIKENIDETVFMFALFKCRKSDKGRN